MKRPPQLAPVGGNDGAPGGAPAGRSLPTVVAAAAIVDSLTQPRFVLAARRSAPKSLAGQWEFPGGKIEPGEGAEHAVHREIREELGVEIVLGREIVPDDDARLGDADRPSGDDAAATWPLAPNLTLRLFLARIESGEPLPLEDHDELRWLPLDADPATAVPWLPGDLPMVERLRKLLPLA